MRHWCISRTGVDDCRASNVAPRQQRTSVTQSSAVMQGTYVRSAVTDTDAACTIVDAAPVWPVCIAAQDQAEAWKARWAHGVVVTASLATRPS